MADRGKFEEQVERLLPCPTDSDGVEWCMVDDGGFKHHDEGCPYKMRPAVVAALREAAKERDDLRREVDRLQYDLTVIGDMAVGNWDDAVVGRVDKATPPPKNYRELRAAELKVMADLRREVDRLKHDIIRQRIG